jgi:hypothetical protein
MKTLYLAFAYSVLNASGQAEIETTPKAATKWDVKILGPISDGKPPAPTVTPEPIDFTVKSSHTSRMEITKVPEMPDLPPIPGTINVTVQVVEDPQLLDPLPPLPTLPPDNPAVLAQLSELTEKHRDSQLIYVSATVYDNNRTFLTIYPNGKSDGSVTAWSNLNFNHFSGFTTFRVKDAIDATLHDFALLMGIGNTESEDSEELAKNSRTENDSLKIPEMPDITKGGPSFIVVEGAADSPAMDTLEQIHDLYRNEGARMEEAYHAREKAQAERRAYLLANPPKPKEVTIQFWKRNNPSPKGVQALEGRGQP